MPENINTFTLPEEVTNAQANAQNLTAVAGQYAAGEPTISDVLTQKVTEAYGANKDIIQQLDQAIAGYLPAPSVGREQYQNIFNPFARESLVSKYVANQATPMLTYSGLLGQRMGRIEDLIGAGTRGYQGMVAAKLAQAQQAQSLYETLLDQYYKKKNYELDVYKATHPSGSGVGDLTTALKLLGIGQEETGGETSESDLGQFWENEIGFEDLNDAQKQQALNENIDSGKSLDDIAKEILGQKGKTSPSAGIYGATGTPAANVDYSGLQYTGFQL